MFHKAYEKPKKWQKSPSFEFLLMTHKGDWKFRNGNIRLANFGCQTPPIYFGKLRDLMFPLQNSGAALCFCWFMKYPKNDKNHPVLIFCNESIRQEKNFVMLPIGLQILVVKPPLYTTIQPSKQKNWKENYRSKWEK